MDVANTIINRSSVRATADVFDTVSILKVVVPVASLARIGAIGLAKSIVDRAAIFARTSVDYFIS